MNAMPRLMCHWVAGYPDKEGFFAVLSALDAQAAVDWIELQLPFSDPLADGPVILSANHVVLRAGLGTRDVLAMIRERAPQLQKKLAVMTYANLPLVLGLEAFMAEMVACGTKGLIVPDLPFDSPEGQDLIAACRRHGIAWIPVLSPGMGPERLARALEPAAGFVYVTSRVGVTGGAEAGHDAARDLIRKIRTLTDLPIALGFGIRSKEAVRALDGVADMAIVGSHLLRLYQETGLGGIKRFLAEIFLDGNSRCNPSSGELKSCGMAAER